MARAPPVPVAIAIDGTRELRADSNDNKTPGVEQEVRESDLSASQMRDASTAAAPKSSPLATLLLGQLISLLITGTGVFSDLLPDYNYDAPVVQSSLNYMLLTALLAFRTQGGNGHSRQSNPSWWKFALWALIDVEANFLVVWAYQYTSIASVMLLDCFTIPSSMIFSCLLLSMRYKAPHIMASLVCAVGLAVTVYSDVLSKDTRVRDAPVAGAAWKGDALVLMGACLYGLSNVMQEGLLKVGCGRCTALGFLGVFGTIISVIQAAVLEWNDLGKAKWSLKLVMCLLGFQLCLFAMYTVTSIFLGWADSALFNLSLLTSDVYSVTFAWLVRGRKPTAWYCIGFVITVSGLVLYHTRGPPTPAMETRLTEVDRTPLAEQLTRDGDGLSIARVDAPLSGRRE